MLASCPNCKLPIVNWRQYCDPYDQTLHVEFVHKDNRICETIAEPWWGMRKRYDKEQVGFEPISGFAGGT